MRSAARTENPLFTRARVRLTIWYVAVLAGVLVVLGSSLYVLVREQTWSRIDSGLKLTAARAESDLLTGDMTDINRLNQVPYYVKVIQGGTFTRTPDEIRANLPVMDSLTAVQTGGQDIRTEGDGDDARRVYSEAVVRDGSIFGYVQVARSTKPERDALSNLLGALFVGGLAGLVLAAIGGWFLAGKSLAPVQEAFEHQRAFVADASHELRTPLAVIRANAEYLQADQPDNTELHEIVRESDRLANLVDSLLALARGDKDTGADQRIVFDIGKEVDAAVGTMEPLAGERGIELTVSTIPLFVRGDPDAIRQLIVILLDNALRYTGEDGRVHVQTAADGNNALITVHDTGIGIREESLPHVFERFYRADDARNRESGGSGLGLAIARELVSQHGGKIDVESAKGVGTTFIVRLPLAKAALDRVER
jgi:two-component system, OmpR family, sensor histidine kinase CiaH